MTKTTVKTEIKDVAIIISQRELIERLLQVRGTTFIQLSATTEPKMNKTGNPLFGNVVKNSITNSIVGFSYENMVNNARGKELSVEVREACLEAGVSEEILAQFSSEVKELARRSADNFKAADRKWGKHSVNQVTGETSRILIEHDKKVKGTTGEWIEHRFYLQVAILGTKTPVYRYKESGEKLSPEDLTIAKSFMPKRKEGERQNLKNPIIVRDYRVDNVTRVHLNKAQYKLS